MDDIRLTDELRIAIDEGVAELGNGEGLPHENVLDELQVLYPYLNFSR